MTAALDSPPQAVAFALGRYLARFDADALVRSPDYRRRVRWCAGSRWTTMPLRRTNPGDVRRRWSSHVWASRQPGPKTAVRSWIAKHGPENVQLLILEQCADPADLPAAERCWVSALRSQGVALLNHTDGGEGLPGWSPTAEQRAAMSARSAGRSHSEETKARIRANAIMQRAVERAAGKPFCGLPACDLNAYAL